MTNRFDLRQLRRGRALMAPTIAVLWLACHSAPPPAPPAPRALGDSAAAALRWVQSHTAPIVLADSTPGSEERTRIATIASGARIVGFSELTEGTGEFPEIVRRSLVTLADSGFRGIALQVPMPEALEVDRYVRSGIGDPRRLLHALGSWRWETREMLAFVAGIRQWNVAHPDRQLGIYGFEIPTAELAVRVITSLPDSVTGAALKQWLARTYACVGIDESAHWGLEGRAADSTFWNACGPATTAGADSVAALLRRVNASSRAASDVAFAAQMARLVQHHVSVGLRHLTRHDANAEHVLFVANSLGADARIVLWGGDVEMGRLTLQPNTVQTAVPLGQRLGDRYRSIAFAIGDGVIRARVPSSGGRGGGEPGLSTTRVAPPAPDSYEDVMSRAAPAAYWLDLRGLPSDTAGAWLRGPRPMRLISELYSPLLASALVTPIVFPTYYDALVFVKTATPARQ
ncbi:MAG TPA: erythromycin esterase family protein [Gemmatimonadaceae bacterium]|nr:erythromycin esterase family protein [Gemmatimonadaceae bacterium]